MRQQDWGELFATYHTTHYNRDKLNERIEELFTDKCVTNRKGIYEYVLSGENDTKLLNVRFFDPSTIQLKYNQQTKEARAKGVSNCPICATCDNTNKDRIYELAEMDADHVSAWSRGGTSDISNCELLWKTHNRAKGNR